MPQPSVAPSPIRQYPRSTVRIVRATAIPTAALAVVVAVPVAFGAQLSGGTRYEGKTADGNPVKLQLSRNAKFVSTIRIDYKVTCDNGGSGKTYTRVRKAAINSQHRFTGSGKYEGTDDGSTNTFKVKGTVSRKRASGTFTLTSKGSDPDTGDAVVCKTGLLRWHAARVR
jgi:uncharacterized protein with FMN-binding domain